MRGMRGRTDHRPVTRETMRRVEAALERACDATGAFRRPMLPEVAGVPGRPDAPRPAPSRGGGAG